MSKQSIHDIDRIQFKYIVLMANIFQIIFNNLPQLIIQSMYFIRHCDFVQFASIVDINLFVIFKIIISLFRLSQSSALFVNYFLVYEFDIKCFQIARNCQFMLFRILSNSLTLLSRILPFIFVSIHLPKCVLIILFYKYLRNFIYELINYNVPNRTNKLKHNFLSVFWCFIISVLRTSVLINEFETWSFKKYFSNTPWLVNFIFSFFENLLVFVLLFSYFDTGNSVLVSLLSFVMYFSSVSIEFFYWTFVNPKRPFIGMNFKNWVVMQSIGSMNSEIIGEDETFLNTLEEI